MPEWLLCKDNYIPPKERDSFIDKSILSLLGVISKLKVGTGKKINRLGVSARAKLLTAVVMIILISLSRSPLFLLIIGAELLLILAMLEASEIKYTLKNSALGGIFTLIILLPSFFMGNRSNSVIIVIKVIETIAAVSILSSTTTWYALANALRQLYVPDIFIFVFDITMKYVMLLGEFSLDMLYSLKLRSVGRNKKKESSLSGIAGTMFLKSKEMAEELQGAMECRGFVGEYKTNNRDKFKINDLFCGLLMLLCVLSYFYFDRL